MSSKEEMGSWSEVDGRLVLWNADYRRQDDLCASMMITTKFKRGIRLLICQRVGHGLGFTKNPRVSYCQGCVRVILNHLVHVRITEVNDIADAPIADGAC